MPVINLFSKYESKLEERFKQRSFTEAWVGSNYSWEGVNSIKTLTLLTDELNDYDSTASANRFGTPTEVEDELHVYALTKKRSFSKVFDITHVQDQMFTKNANAYLKQMWDERYVPEIDKYRLATWAAGAGMGTVGARLTKTSVVEAVLTAKSAMMGAGVPGENMVCFMRSDVAIATRLASELASNQNWTTKAIVNGKIAEIDGMAVVSVPESYLPNGVAFIIKYKQATADPTKLRMLRANNEAPGYAGTLMEGLARYDSFVLDTKADGVYVYADSSNGVSAAPTITQSGNTVTITGASGATVKYTTDGSNPKTSGTAKVYSAAITITKNTKIRAYAVDGTKLNSAIASYDATYTAG